MVYNCNGVGSLAENKYQRVFLKIEQAKEKRVFSSHLSDSNTKCWLSGSLSAFAKSRFSASTIEILPHTTCVDRNHQVS